MAAENGEWESPGWVNAQCPRCIGGFPKRQRALVMWPFHGDIRCPLSLGELTHIISMPSWRGKGLVGFRYHSWGCQGTWCGWRMAPAQQQHLQNPCAESCGGTAGGWVPRVALPLLLALDIVLVVAVRVRGSRTGHGCTLQGIWAPPMGGSSTRALKAKLGSCFRRGRRTEKLKGWYQSVPWGKG